MDTHAVTTLAYLQAKKIALEERLTPNLSDYVEFERDLSSSLNRILRGIERGSWFDALPLGHVHIAPKSATYPTPATARIRVGSHQPRRPNTLSVRIAFAPSPEFAAMETYYLYRFAARFEGLLGSECVANRITMRGEGPASHPDIQYRLFEPWSVSYDRYRSEPVATARKALHKGQTVDVVHSDFRSYYDNIDRNYFSTPEFASLLATRNDSPFDASEYLRATASLVRRFDEVFSIAGRLIGCNATPTTGIPIGAATSRVFANIALIDLDRAVTALPNVSCYLRYVDDFVAVIQTNPDAAQNDSQDILSWIPVASIKNGERGVSSRFGRHTFNIAKSVLHQLSGPTAELFLDSVTRSFTEAISERSKFLFDETAAQETLRVTRTSRKHNADNALSKLRSSDDLSLERFRAQSLLLQLSSQLAITGRTEETKAHVKSSLEQIAQTIAHGHDFDDLEVAVHAYKVAALSGVGDSKAAISDLIQEIISTADSVPLFWGVVRCNPTTTLGAVRTYFAAHRTQGSAMCANPNRSPLAASFRRSGLRHLSASDDSEMFSWSDANPKASSLAKRALAFLYQSEHLRPWISAHQRFVRHTGGLNDAELLASLLDPRRLIFEDVFESFSDLLTGSANHGPSMLDVLEVCDAIVGTRSAAMSEAFVTSHADGHVTVNLAERTRKECRVFVVSFPTSVSDLVASTKGPIIPRRETLLAIHNAFEAVDRSSPTSNPRLIVLPELSVPFRARKRVRKNAKRRGLSAVYGVDYQRDSSGHLFNVAEGFFPITPYHWGLFRWFKRHPAENERSNAISYPGFVKQRPRLVIEGTFGRLGVLICSELMEPDALHAYRGNIELLAVPAWNTDAEVYDALARTVSEVIVHAFVAIANASEASDARIVAPVKEPRFRRAWCRIVLRGGETGVVWGDLPIGELAEFHRGRKLTDMSSASLAFRPLPPGWRVPKAPPPPRSGFEAITSLLRRHEASRRRGTWEKG